ncbi:MAG: phosphoribosyl-ATP diphosphatase [Spirochaetales bacterium]|nr:phosphoribosyl-ATP diphosphatase [Spirochaetales bacterium]
MKEHPLVIRDLSGRILAVGMENEKGFNKSLEQKELWCLHPETGRLIPYGEFGEKAGLSRISRQEGWYEAVLETAADGQEPFLRERDVDAAGPCTEGNAKVDVSGTGTVLSALAAVVRERRRDMPEGSYTTHLFAGGEGKIRKKLGEEAVELILAEEDEDIVYEAADLLYHLLVFLEAKGISLDAVLKELSSRAR